MPPNNSALYQTEILSNANTSTSSNNSDNSNNSNNSNNNNNDNSNNNNDNNDSNDSYNRLVDDPDPWSLGRVTYYSEVSGWLRIKPCTGGGYVYLNNIHPEAVFRWGLLDRGRQPIEFKLKLDKPTEVWGIRVRKEGLGDQGGEVGPRTQHEE